VAASFIRHPAVDSRKPAESVISGLLCAVQAPKQTRAFRSQVSLVVAGLPGWKYMPMWRIFVR